MTTADTREELEYMLRKDREKNPEYEKQLLQNRQAIVVLQMQINRKNIELMLAEGTDGYGATKAEVKVLTRAVMALEKQIPKPVVRQPWSITKCPTCGGQLGEHIGDGYTKEWDSMLVCNCGQQLDWSFPEDDEDEE